jgi:hypothetical protein
MHRASRSASCASTFISRQSAPNSESAAPITWLVNCLSFFRVFWAGGWRRR